MKVEKKITMVGLILFVFGTALWANPETTELREPVAVKVVVPVVPYSFASLGISGKVDVEFKIDENGRPRAIRVEDASHPEYAESVRNALRRWRFEEASTEITYRLPVLFNRGEAN